MLIKNVGQRALRVTVRSGHNTSTANAAAVITLAAVADKVHCIHQLQWSYSAAPVAGKLTVTVGGVTTFEVDVTSAGPGGFGLELPGSVNSAVVIILAAGGGTTVGKLNIQYTTEKNVIEHR